MKLSAASVSFEVLSLEAIGSLVRDLGFDELDIYGHSKRARAHLEPAEIAADPQVVADRVNRMKEQNGLAIGDFFPTFGVGVEDRAVNHPDANVRRENRAVFRKMVEFARLIGAPGITLSPGVALPGIHPGEAFETAARALRELVEDAGSQGIHLRVEPHVGSVLHTPELVLEMVERVQGLKVTLDYSHFSFLYVAPERVHALIPHTDHFHVRSAKKGRLQTRWSENEIDFADIFRRLQEAKYQGCIALEYVCQDWYDANQLDVLSETALAKKKVEQILAAIS